MLILPSVGNFIKEPVYVHGGVCSALYVCIPGPGVPELRSDDDLVTLIVATLHLLPPSHHRDPLVQNENSLKTCWMNGTRNSTSFVGKIIHPGKVS